MVTLVPSPNRSLKLVPPAVTQWRQHERLPTATMGRQVKTLSGRHVCILYIVVLLLLLKQLFSKFV